jgi:hypothetical protein
VKPAAVVWHAQLVPPIGRMKFFFAKAKIFLAF